MRDGPVRVDNAIALGACIATYAVFDALYTASRGTLGSPGYPLLVTGLSLVVAVPLALAFRGGTDRVLAIWVALTALAHLPEKPMLGLGLGVLGAGAVLGTGRLLRSATPPASRGVCVGFALFVGFVCVPAVTDDRLVIQGTDPVSTLLSMGGSFAIALLAVTLLETRPPRIARLGLGAIAGLGVCVATVAWAHAAAIARAPAPRFASPPAAAGPNIFVLILDTVRADHLSLYGYERDTTPRLRERLSLENGAVVYPNAYSTSNWTRPAHVSLFSGRLPSEHGCHERTCGFHEGYGGTAGVLEIALEDTLAQRLAAVGYRTGGVMGNRVLWSLDGLGNGFDVWVRAQRSAPLHGVGEFLRRKLLVRRYASQRIPLAPATSVNRGVLSLLEGCEQGGCFVVANYIDAHQPYFANHPYAGRFGAADVRGMQRLNDTEENHARSAAAYDEQILELDAHVGALLDEIDRRGLLDDAWLFVTSDHGESFGEHGSVGHATDLYDDQVRIPLVVQPPRGVTLPPPPLSPVGLLDVTATISAIATGSPMGRGRDLRGDADSLVQIEFFGWKGPVADDGPLAGLPMRAVVQGRQKLIEIDREYELYQLAGDPGERVDLSSTTPEEVDRLAPLLPPLKLDRSKVRRVDTELDSESSEALRALGYVE